MKLPKSFIPKKELNRNIKQLLKGPKEIENHFALQELLESCQEFTEKRKPLDWETNYNLSLNLASNIDYNKSHLEQLSQELILKEHTERIGLHFSALVNKIITKQDEINLTFNHEFNYIGTYLEKGKLTIQGDAGYQTGYHMQGGAVIIEGNARDFIGYGMENGKIIVKGNVGDFTGIYMENGKIIVKGNAGNFTGYKMCGGELIVLGKIEKIDQRFKKGTIIQGNKIVKQA